MWTGRGETLYQEAGSRPRRPPRGDRRGPVPHSHPSLLTATPRVPQAALGQSVPTAAWGCPHPPSTPRSLPSARAWACRRGRQAEEATVLGPTSRGRPLTENRLRLRSQRRKLESGENLPDPNPPPANETCLHGEQPLHLPLLCRGAHPPGQPLQDTLSFRCWRQRLGKNLQDPLHSEVSVTNSVLSRVRREGEALRAATSAAM